MRLFGSSVPDDLLAARGEFDALVQSNSERLGRFTQYRAEGNKVRAPDVGSGAINSDYGTKRNDGQPQRHRIHLPLGKAMTVKHSFRIAGAPPDVIVDQRDDSPTERHRSDTMEKIVWASWRASRGDTQISSGAWYGSELGTTAFDIYWDIRAQLPRFRAFDPAGCIEVQGSDDPHDFQRFYRAWDVPLKSLLGDYQGKTFRGAPIDLKSIGATHTTGGVEMVRIVQLCDRDHYLRFAQFGSSGVVGLHEYFHNYGFVPNVLIPNIGPYEDVWGWADYEFVRALVEYIPQMFSREADVLKAVAAGAYQDNGSGMNAATLAKVIRNGGVANTKRDAKIEPIQAAEMPAFAEAHSDRAMQMLKMLGFAPDAAWGLPGSGSGTDRGLQLQPLLEYTAMKQLNWQSGLSRLFGMGYQMIEQKMVGSSKYRGSVHGRAGRRTPFVLTFGPDAAPTQAVVDSPDGLAEPIDLPNSPKELFDGDYEVRFNWRNRVDPEDPQYVMSELNKFQQGVQSLETTLESLGVQAPEDEMTRIEKEAQRFPWVNQGVVSLIMAQVRGNAQGSGGGAPVDQTGALGGAMDTMAGLGGGGQSGALNADAGAAALGPDATGIPYGGA